MRHEARGAYYAQVCFKFRPGLFRVSSIELLDSELYSSVQSIEFNCSETFVIYHMAIKTKWMAEQHQNKYLKMEGFGGMPGLKHVYLHPGPSLPRQDRDDALLIAFVRRMFEDQKLLVDMS